MTDEAANIFRGTKEEWNELVRLDQRRQRIADAGIVLFLPSDNGAWRFQHQGRWREYKSEIEAIQAAEVAIKEDRTREAEREREAKEFAANRAFEAIHLPDAVKKQVRNYQPRTPAQKEAWNKTDDLVRYPKPLIFLGPAGSGKTALACAAAVRYIESGNSAHFCTPGEIVRCALTEGDGLHKFKTVPLLVIDKAEPLTTGDLEAAMIVSALGAKHVRELLQHRAITDRATIIVADCDAATLRSHLGASAFDGVPDSAIPSLIRGKATVIEFEPKVTPPSFYGR